MTTESATPATATAASHDPARQTAHCPVTVGLYIDSYLPVLDGVTLVVRNYATLLNRHYGKCFVVAPAMPGHRDSEPYDIIRFNSIPVPGKAPYRTGLPHLDFKYLNRIRDYKADIIHSHAPFGAGLSGLLTAKANKLPLVATFHSKYYDDFKLAFHSELIAELGVEAILKFYNMADSVWAVNRSTAYTLREYGFRGDIEIMPNGTEFIPPADREASCAAVNEALHIASDAVLLLFVGRLVWNKNIETLARAAADLKKSGMDFHLAVIGSGEAEKGFAELVRKLGIDDRVHLPGVVSDRDYLKKIYTRANLFVFPSLYDNSPIVVKEAAACQCPSLVIRDSNSAEGIEDDRNGFLCENDPAAIAARIRSLFAHREHLAEVGRLAQETLYVPWENIMGKVYARYCELIAEKAGRTVSRRKSRKSIREGDGT